MTEVQKVQGPIDDCDLGSCLSTNTRGSVTRPSPPTGRAATTAETATAITAVTAASRARRADHRRAHGDGRRP